MYSINGIELLLLIWSNFNALEVPKNDLTIHFRLVNCVYLCMRKRFQNFDIN